MMKRLFILLLSFCATYSVQAAQECDSSVPQTTPTANFTDNGDGTISDTVTRRMWKKCVEGLSGNNCATGTASQFTWQMALQQVGTVNADPTETYNDWRLPNIKELASIVELQCYSPASNLTLFPATPMNPNYNSFDPPMVTVYDAFLWSSTPSTSNASAQPASGKELAWGVDFAIGLTLKTNKSSGVGFVRLVRDY
jgi:hypothetical protein